MTSVRAERFGDLCDAECRLVSRFFGGPPLAVLFRLVLLCVLVGVILHALGFDPGNIIDSIRRMIQGVWDMGFDAVRWVWRYFLLGADHRDPDLADRALHAHAAAGR